MAARSRRPNGCSDQSRLLALLDMPDPLMACNGQRLSDSSGVSERCCPGLSNP